MPAHTAGDVWLDTLPYSECTGVGHLRHGLPPHYCCPVFVAVTVISACTFLPTGDMCPNCPMVESIELAYNDILRKRRL